MTTIEYIQSRIKTAPEVKGLELQQFIKKIAVESIKQKNLSGSEKP